jgi:hypothetical protein
VGALDAEHLEARVRVGVEVQKTNGAVTRGDCANVRLGDRVVSAEHDGQNSGVDDLADEPLDRLVRSLRIGGNDRSVAVVDDAQLPERVDLRLEMRTRRAARRADRAGREARPRPVRDEIVGRSANDRDVERRELRCVLRIRSASERQEPGVVRLVAERLPPLEGVDRAQKSF